MPTMLEVNGLAHTYGRHVAVDELTFAVEAGQLACIVGPSGCGKSTLLRCIAGLITPTGGEVRLHGDLVRGVPADLAVVFQDYSRSLFPWLSVRGNVEFPLRGRLRSRAERRARASGPSTRGSSPAGCSSGCPSPAPWPAGRRCC
jgi:NitT/TauT family transport system ATP-binding protein